MKMLRIYASLSAVVLLTAFAACGGGGGGGGGGSGTAGQNQACGSVITTDITLTADLDCSGTGGSGLIIGADNITIDGNGHTITGTYSTPPVDIADPTKIQAGVKNFGYSQVTIKNLHVENFFLGIAEAGPTSAMNNITIEDDTITNNVLYDLSFIFPVAILIYNSNQNTVLRNQIGGYANGILLTNATNNVISSNSIISASNAGIDVSAKSTDTSTITDNFIKSSASVALVLGNANAGSRASVSGNIFLFNYQDMDGGANVNFAKNHSLHNINNRMINFATEPDKNLHQGDSARFVFNMEDGANNDCHSCIYSLATTPSETITSALNNNTVTGSFVASKLGIYSLQITVTDGSGNIGKRNMLFYVDSNPTSSLATVGTTYYIRPDIDPVHGQAKGRDARSMLLAAPTEASFERCSQWVVSHVDELPNYPFGTISEENINFWHKESRSSHAYIRRFTHNLNDYISQQSIALSADYTFSNADFRGLAWNMDYPYSWYNLVFEFGIPFGAGTDPYVETTVAQPSTDTITHVYTTTPAIQSFSNPDVLLLAANPSSDNSPLATLTLDGSYIEGVGASHSVKVKLDNYSYPFDKDMTEINSDGTATLVVSDLSDEETYASVPLTITPASGYVDTAIGSWNTGTGGDYTKRWTEVASASGISVNHIVAQMAANKNYDIYVDGNLYKKGVADTDGKLSFSHISSDSLSHDFFIASECSEKHFWPFFGRKQFPGGWLSNLWPDLFQGCGMPRGKRVR